MTCDPELPVPPGQYGGVERLVSGLCKEYQRMGHEVYLVANAASTESVKKFFGWQSSSSRGWRNVLVNGTQLRRIVQEVKPDIIHSFSRLMYFYPMFLSGIKVPFLQTYGRAISRKSTNLAKRICGRYANFACCGAHMLQRLDNHQRWYVVPNFTDTDTLTPSTKEKEYLVFLGRIEDIKGTNEAIQVAKKSNLPLVIAGNIAPEHQHYFDEKVRPYIDGEKIKYVGPVDDIQKRQLFAGAKAFLMPIKWEEPFGIVMIEAMACGVPVLAFRRGAAPEIVTEGTGFISSGIEEMARDCQRLESIDRSDLRDYVEMKYSRSKVAEMYISLFNEILNKKLQ